MASQYLPRTLAVTVTSGTGTVVIPRDHAGPCIGASFRPPASNPATTFDFEVFDSEDFGIIGADSNTGPTTMLAEFQLHDGGSVDITNASEDGAWEVRLWYREDQ